LARRVLVTGGAGFVGSHLVRRLVESGEDVVVYVRQSGALTRIDDLLEWVDVVRGDDPLPSASTIYHLAASGLRPGDEPADVAASNLLLTQRLLEHAGATRAERFVQCGSCFEYGPGERFREDAPLRPISPYAASKAAASLLALGYGSATGLPVVLVRPFTVYGPYEAGYRLVPSAINAALDGGPIELTSGRQRRDFVYVDDVVEGILRAGAADVAGDTFNLCTGTSTSVLGLANTVSEACGGVDVKAGVLPDRRVEFSAISGDPDHARNVLGWSAKTPLRLGIERTVTWFRAHRNRFPDYATGGMR
jgi:nucleoside-diphosphate-sugar epimerase